MKHPNGIWIWNLSDIRKDYLNTLAQTQCKRVYLKVLDDATDGIFWGWQCTPDIVNAFKNQGIEVYGWGYVFDRRLSTSVSGIIDALRKIIGCGIKGFVFDVEQEVEDTSTHAQLREILIQAQQIIPSGCMGYTSFGAPECHPNFPWKMLNEICDLQFPQIYYEKFTFGSGSTREEENKSEVEDCLQQHKNMGLDKPILPIWGSESDSQYPTTANELQRYLTQYPGSSVWRAPNAGERGEAWNCNYNYAIEIPDGHDTPAPQPQIRPYQKVTLPLQFSRDLKLGHQGEDVYVLICALMELGFLGQDSQVTDTFNNNVDTAVRWSQQKLNVDVDGEVGVNTKSALEYALHRTRGDVIAPSPQQVLEIATRQIGYKENPPNSNHTKYGVWDGTDYCPWCAIFVSYCFYTAGLPLPITTDKGFAYCPDGVNWFKQKGWWRSSPNVGDVVFYNWSGDGIADHVGIVERVNSDGSIDAIEGNTSVGDDSNGGQVMRRTRMPSNILGYGRPPYGNIPSPPPSPPHPSWPGRYIFLTTPYMEGNDVLLWQRQMIYRGWTLGSNGASGKGDDSVFGEQSHEALIKFQEQKRLEIDGKIGPMIWNAVFELPITSD